MRKKTVILLTSYLIAAVVALGFSIYKNSKESADYNLFVNNTYQRSFSELVTAVNEINTSLQKTIYATSPSMINATSTQVFGRAMAAQMILAELPFSNYELHETAGFIAKVGDYAYALSVKSAGGDMPASTDLQNLKSLSDTASTLSTKLIELQTQVGHGSITIKELKNTEAEIGSVGDNNTSGSLGESFQLIESEFPELPSLIYDGPYSEHLDNKIPKLIENKAEISADEARNIAASFLGVDHDKTSHIGERGGNIPCYLISATTNCGDLTVLVTKQGGAVLSAFGSYEAQEAVMTPEDAVEKAKTFLSERGFPDMKESYWTVYNNVALVNFAYSQDGVICYPDLIKVSVSLECGDIVGFEALGYVTNHQYRNLPQIEVSDSEARRLVSSELEILSHELAIIPTEGENEVFCHEFKCLSPEGRHYIIYVDAVTGEEEDILILIEDEGGTLTL